MRNIDVPPVFLLWKHHECLKHAFLVSMELNREVLGEIVEPRLKGTIIYQPGRLRTSQEIEKGLQLLKKKEYALSKHGEAHYWNQWDVLFLL